MLLSLSAASVFAQSSLIATLSHEGEIMAFYGANALKEAHEAAAHGDAITLSSGTFNATDITKAVTLRGAGMQVDTVNNVLPTIISGDFIVEITDEVDNKLTMEGIYHNATMTLKGTLTDARFIKNRFSTISAEAYNNGYLVNSIFLHCKIVAKFAYTQNDSDIQFSNCYIKSLDRLNTNSGTSHILLANCIIKTDEDNAFYWYCNVSLNNCLLEGVNKSNLICDRTPVAVSTVNAYNNVAVNCHNNECFSGFTNTTNSYSTYTEFFKDYTGTYNDDITFELTDEAKAKFLGTDDTQVGIHGGSFPYDPTTTNPHITKCNVAAKSTADGKLSVDIEVAGVE